MPEVGGIFIQMEDEMATISSVIGARATVPIEAVGPILSLRSTEQHLTSCSFGHHSIEGSNGFDTGNNLFTDQLWRSHLQASYTFMAFIPDRSGN